MRVIAATIALSLASPALAGGIGLTLGGGAHTEPVYYYSTHNYSGNRPIPYSDPDEYEQGKQTQMLPQSALGAEFVLGDRTAKIMGVFRGSLMSDSPQNDPTDTQDDFQPQHIVTAYREEARLSGVGLMGITVGLVGQPTAFQFGFGARLGSGFLTTDHTEYLLIEAGPMITYNLSRQLQATVDVAYQGRYRKAYTQGVHSTGGLRWLFD